MLGHLVPCGGGKSIPLLKSRLVLKPRSSGDTEAAVDQAELVFRDGWWHVNAGASGMAVQVNDAPCKEKRIQPDDVLTIGRTRFRIEYTPPGVVEAPPPELPPRPVAEPSPLGSLVPCGGGPAILLWKPKITIGRAPTCDVVLPQKVVSSRHCSLELVDGYWRMTDLESKNGTTVDGMTFHAKWVLPNSILGILNQRFRLEYEAKGERPSLADDDVAVAPRQSLLQRAGVSQRRLDDALSGMQPDDSGRRRYNLDDDT